MKHTQSVIALSLLCIVLLNIILAACAPAAAPATVPTMRITSPAVGASVNGPTVTINVEVQNFTLVDANIPVKDGEGHLHFFIDAPATSVPLGQAIPVDPKYVHAGKAPYTSRDIPLSKGPHTITVVAGNAGHVVLALPAPVSVSFTVQ